MRLSAGLLLMCTLPVFGQDADLCKDILNEHLKDIVTASSSMSFESTVQNWMCSNRGGSEQHSQDSGLSVGVPIQGVPVQFGGNLDGADASAWFDNHCGSNAGSISSNQAQFVAASLMPRESIGAWKQCMFEKLGSHRNDSLTIEYSLNGSEITFTIHWQPDPRKMEQPVVTGNTLVAGANCDNPLRDGDKLNGSQIVLCHRLGSSPVTFALNTDQGGAGPVNVPAPVPVPRPVVRKIPSLPPPTPPLPASGQIYALVPRESGNGTGGLVLETSGCREAAGSAVDIWGSSGATNQQWYLSRSNDWQELSLAQNNNKCLEVAPNGVSIQIGDCQSNQPSQHWKLEAHAEGQHLYYTIGSMDPNKTGYLTVAGGALGRRTPGTAVALQTSPEDPYNQQWEFLYQNKMGFRGCGGH